MSIYDDYRLLRTVNGDTKTQRFLNRDKKELANALANSPTSFTIQMDNNDYKMIVVSRRQDIESFDKKFTCEYNVPMQEGSIIVHKNKKWLMIHNLETEYEVSKTAVGRKITNESKIMIDGKQKLIPFVYMNTFNAQDAIDRKFSNSIVYDYDSKESVVLMPKTDDTIKITQYTRFFIGTRPVEVTFVNTDFTGLVICSVRMVNIDSKVDDLSSLSSTPEKNNITNEEFSYSLTGTQEFLIGEKVDFITNFDAEFTIENQSLVNILYSDSRKITLQGLQKGTTYINGFENGLKKISFKIKVIGLI